MKLFSWRKSFNDRQTFKLSESLKTRLLTLLNFCIKSWFLEDWIVFYFHWIISWIQSDILSLVTKWELWYSMNDFFDCERLEFDPQCWDYYILDLIEIMVIFSKESKREEFVKRIKEIFYEEREQNTFTIHWYIIIENNSNEFQSIIPFIKDAKIRDKLETYYRVKATNPDSSILAKTSADIINYILSSEAWEFKKYMDSLFNKIWSKIALDKPEELTNLLLKLADYWKWLNNKIDNVRHTERSTIPIIEQCWIYKFIADNNMNIIELIITSLPEDYISNWDVSEVKKWIVEKYNLDLLKAEIRDLF